MIDPVDLMFLQRLENLGVQRFGRRQIVAEGFFDHDAAPLAVVFRHQTRSAKAGDRLGKETIRDGEVEEAVARGVGGLLQSGQVFAQPPVGTWIVEVALHVAHAVAEPSPRGLIQLLDLELATAGDEALHCFGEAFTPVVCGLAGQVYADEPKAIGQLPAIDQVVERRHDQTFGQVAGGAEDHHGAGRRHRCRLGLRLVFGLRVWVSPA